MWLTWQRVVGTPSCYILAPSSASLMLSPLLECLTSILYSLLWKDLWMRSQGGSKATFPILTCHFLDIGSTKEINNIKNALVKINIVLRRARMPWNQLVTFHVFLCFSYLILMDDDICLRQWVERPANQSASLVNSRGQGKKNCRWMVLQQRASLKLRQLSLQRITSASKRWKSDSPRVELVDKEIEVCHLGLKVVALPINVWSYPDALKIRIISRDSCKHQTHVKATTRSQICLEPCQITNRRTQRVHLEFCSISSFMGQSSSDDAMHFQIWTQRARTGRNLH